METPNIVRFLGVADIASGILGIAVASWLGDQLGLPTLLVAATGAFLVAFGIASLRGAEAPVMAKATVVVEAGSAVTLLGVLAAADPTGVGAAIAIGLTAWCVAAAVTVGLPARRLAH